MFLFRRRKENTDNSPGKIKQDEIEKLEKQARQIKAAKAVKPAEKEKKEKPLKKADASAPARDPFFQSEDTLQIIENDTPVKVVIPASALLEDDAGEVEEEEAKAPETGMEPLPEDVVDGLFVKVNNDKVLDEDVSLDDILPGVLKKAVPKKTEPQPAAEAAKKEAAKKADPAKPALAEKMGEFVETQAQSAAVMLPGATAEAGGKTPEAAITQGKPENKPGVETNTQGQVTEAKLAAAEAKLAAAEVKLAVADAKPAAADPKLTAADTKLPAATEAKSPAAEVKQPEKKKEGEETKDNLFSQLFGKVEQEEETPLDRLIKALPEISIEEVMNEAEEVKGLMSEWFQNQPK
jgi:hypothetical protein